MKYLLEAARQYGLDSIADRFLEYENVHGIIISIRPEWLMVYYHHLKYPQAEIDISYWYDHYFRLGLMPSGRGGYPMFSTHEKYFDTVVPLDLSWRPKYWNDHIGTQSNLLVRVQLRPGTKPIEQAQSEQSLTIVQEYSPVPQLASKKMLRPLEGGVSIGHGNDNPGTLGGILSDIKTGKKYGLTCGHVIAACSHIVDQPSKIDSAAASAIGNCTYTTSLVGNNGHLCNPRNTAYLNEMDIALIDLDQQIQADHSVLNIGAIKSYTPGIELHPNLGIEFNGRSSGYQNLAIGGIGLVQEFQNPATGAACCFKNLIEIKQPNLASLVINRPVKGGDSGAWIVVNGKTGLEWAGMIIGEDRQSGYAIHSEDIISHLRANGYDLRCA